MAENLAHTEVPEIANNKMVVQVKINGILKQMQLPGPVCKIITSFLVTAFLKNKETDSYEPEEKLMLYFISSGVPMVCVVFKEPQYEMFEKQNYMALFISNINLRISGSRKRTNRNPKTRVT